MEVLARKMLDLLRGSVIGQTDEDKKFLDILKKVHSSVIPVENDQISYTKAVDMYTDQILKEIYLPRQKGKWYSDKNEGDIPEYTEGTKRGIIFCHGHIHKTPIIPELEDKVDWTMVDISEETHPDLVGSFNSWETYKALGLHSYDYILSYHCPIHGGAGKFDSFIKNVRWLLKPGGKLLIKPLRVNVRKDNKVVSDSIITKMASKYGYEADFKNNMLKFSDFY